MSPEFITVKGIITYSNDEVSSAGATGFGSSGLNQSGIYVSGITARLLNGDRVVAVATVTQVRSDMWIPDPPEVMGRKIGDKIRQFLRGSASQASTRP